MFAPGYKQSINRSNPYIAVVQASGDAPLDLKPRGQIIFHQGVRLRVVALAPHFGHVLHGHLLVIGTVPQDVVVVDDLVPLALVMDLPLLGAVAALMPLPIFGRILFHY